MRLCLRREVVNLRSRVLGRLVEMDAHSGLRWNVTVLVVGAGYRDSAVETTVYTFGEFNGLGACLTAM